MKHILLPLAFLLLASTLVYAGDMPRQTRPLKIDQALKENKTQKLSQTDASSVPMPIKKHWSGLPFFGEEAQKRGYDIEPPFVLAYHFEHHSQYVKAKDGSLKYKGIETDVGKTWGNSIGLGDAFAGLVRIEKLPNGDPDIYIETSKAKERTTTNGMRLGTWIFPFMQVYGLYNEIQGESIVQARSVTHLGGPLSGIIDQGMIDSMMPGAKYLGNGYVETNDRIKISLDAQNYGFGTSIAGGYKKFFAMVDMNYTYTKFDFSSDYAHTFIISPRVGYNTTLYNRPFRIWTGVFGQYVSQKVTGKLTALHFDGSTGAMVPLINPYGTAGFEVRQKLMEPINYIVGARYNITDFAAFMIEGGYAGKYGRKSILTNIELLF